MPVSHTYHVTIKEHHLDTFGHVNNATYLELFEEARWDWITGNGYGLDVVKSSGFGPIILELNVKFKKELTLRQEIKILTRMLDGVGKVFRLGQEMVDPGGAVCCSAEFSFGLFDTAKRKLVQPTERWRKALGLAG